MIVKVEINHEKHHGAFIRSKDNSVQMTVAVSEVLLSKMAGVTTRFFQAAITKAGTLEIDEVAEWQEW
jgi:hypothetical protein